MKQSSGLFDIQVNGFAGIDFNNERIDTSQLDYALLAMLKTGVTTCLPTLITAPFDVLAARFAVLDRAVSTSRLGALMVPGYHLEGPFLNAGDGYAGCHPVQAMCVPDADKVLYLEKHLSRPILLVTYAPEKDTSGDFARIMHAAGKCLSIGHTAADWECVNKAVTAGARLSTHLGNGLPQNMHKFNNPLFAQLGHDALYAGFIADGIHVPFYVLKSLLRAKSIARSILVTDATSVAAAGTGLYRFAAMQIERFDDGSVRVPGSNYLAGSGLTLDQAIRNLIDNHLVCFADAICMASANPLRLLQNTLEHYALSLPASTVYWDESNHARRVQSGGNEWFFDQMSS